MKTYKINNVEVSKESLQEIIKSNPELLEEKKIVDLKKTFHKGGQIRTQIRFSKKKIKK